MEKTKRQSLLLYLGVGKIFEADEFRVESVLLHDPLCLHRIHWVSLIENKFSLKGSYIFLYVDVFLDTAGLPVAIRSATIALWSIIIFLCSKTEEICPTLFIVRNINCEDAYKRH